MMLDSFGGSNPKRRSVDLFALAPTPSRIAPSAGTSSTSTGEAYQTIHHPVPSYASSGPNVAEAELQETIRRSRSRSSTSSEAADFSALQRTTTARPLKLTRSRTADGGPTRGGGGGGGTRSSAYRRLTQVFSSPHSKSTSSHRQQNTPPHPLPLPTTASAPSSPQKVKGSFPLPLKTAPSVLPSHLAAQSNIPDYVPYCPGSPLSPFLPRSPTSPTRTITSTSFSTSGGSAGGGSPTLALFPPKRLSNEEHERMVTHAEEERARRQYVKKQAWFVTPPGQQTRDRDHRFTVEEAPYWRGYGLASADYDALLMQHWLLSEASKPREGEEEEDGKYWPTAARWAGGREPRRVLDIGCGIWCTWILHALKAWGEGTTFVGLDLMPSLLTPAMLAPGEGRRVAFVQHNFLQSLPFEEGSFDLVRISGVGSGVPEHQWDALLSRAVHLLTPEGKLEVVDIEMHTILPSDAELRSAPDSSVTSSTLLRDLLFGLADRRFLNLGHFSTIRAALAVNAGRSSTAGKQLLHYPPPASLNLNGGEEDWKVLLPRLAGAFIRARVDFLLTEYEIALSSRPLTGSLPRMHEPAGREDCRSALEGFCEMMESGEPVARLLSRRWGWECAFDACEADLLEQNAVLLTMQQAELNAEKEVRPWESDEDEDEEDARILARAQVAMNLRETEAERARVGERLKGAVKGAGSRWEAVDEAQVASEVGPRSSRGAAGIQSWVASRPVVLA